ncbi:TetR/AcrR family transcriptional regulator [Actinokineospora sp. G85]|uniref:TetR/AcrR family transcriptional regulator n=1 Tax=Actinokineospora sp. G85 TaxID=3406626 RepID=UPI003C7142FE
MAAFPSSCPQPPRRVDARRNREAILRVAEEVFAEGIEFASLDEVARRAGLGRATVYRHFPDRHALGVAIADRHLAAIRAAVKSCLHDELSLRDLLRSILCAQVVRRPLVRLFLEMPPGEQLRHVSVLTRELEPAFHHSQARGELRPDLVVADLELVFEMIEGAMATGPYTRDRAASTQRLVVAVVDGLFAPAEHRGAVERPGASYQG